MGTGGKGKPRASRKRKTLPKDFGDLLGKAPLDELQAVFDACGLDATGGYSKHTALGFTECPEALARWLVVQGANVGATDTYRRTALHHHAGSWRGSVGLLLDLGADIEARDYQGFTPLHSAAWSHKPEAMRVLVGRGADVHAKADDGRNALELALATTRNMDIQHTAAIAELLLSAGLPVTDATRNDVARIGREFEFHRAGFNPDFLAATDAGLATLYRLSGIAPVAPRVVHDGTSPIVVPAGEWRGQHQALWELLVPSRGAAATVQGEAIRISGRVAHEVLDNGGANWDRDFRAMLDALVAHLGAGAALPAAELAEAQALAATLRSGDGEDSAIHRLSELAVRWVIANPAPMPLAAPAYRR